MIEQGGGGSIVLTSSTASLVAFDGLTSYSASKAGVDQLARQLAFEWGRHNIRVNVINPGYMKSHMRGSNDRYEDADENARIESLTPLARKGAPEELVGPVVFPGLRRVVLRHRPHHAGRRWLVHPVSELGESARVATPLRPLSRPCARCAWRRPDRAGRVSGRFLDRRSATSRGRRHER